MSTAIICSIVLILTLVLPRWVKMAPKQRHELFVYAYFTESIVCLGIVGAWLVVGIRGEYPDFALAPLAVLGILCAIMALRANRVFKHKYGTPAFE